MQTQYISMVLYLFCFVGVSLALGFLWPQTGGRSVQAVITKPHNPGRRVATLSPTTLRSVQFGRTGMVWCGKSVKVHQWPWAAGPSQIGKT